MTCLTPADKPPCVEVLWPLCSTDPLPCRWLEKPHTLFLTCTPPETHLKTILYCDGLGAGAVFHGSAPFGVTTIRTISPSKPTTIVFYVQGAGRELVEAVIKAPHTGLNSMRLIASQLTPSPLPVYRYYERTSFFFFGEARTFFMMADLSFAEIPSQRARPPFLCMFMGSISLVYTHVLARQIIKGDNPIPWLLSYLV